MMRSILMIWFAMCAVVPAQPSADQNTMEPIISALRSQHFDEALSAAKSALKAHPLDYRVWTLEGMALAGKADNPSALAAFRRALTIAPDYNPALKAEARLLFQSGDKQAIAVLRKLIALDPSDKTAQEMLAISSARQNECKSSLQEFAPLDETIQSHPESLQWYGYCLTQEKEFSAAASVFARLVELVPNELEPRFDLALVQTMANQNTNAIQTLQPLITSHSPNVDALTLAAEAYEEAGETPKAVSMLRQAIDLDADNADLYVRFAGLCLSHDSFQVGLDVVNVGLRRIPKNASLYVARGLLYGQTGEYSNAESDLQTAEKLNPAVTASSFALAATAMQHGDLDQALKTVREQLKRHPNDPGLHYMLAKILVDQGAKFGSSEFQEAMKSASMAVRTKPDFVPGHDLLASLYLDAGKSDLATEQCRISLAADPSDQSALYHLIAALRSSGNRIEVQDLVKKLLALQRKTSQQPTARERYKIMERPPKDGDNDH